MSNEIKEEKKVESFKCQICNKESNNSVEAITHYLDHGSSALAAINSLIKEQRTGGVTTEDRARISNEVKTAQKEKGAVVVQEA